MTCPAGCLRVPGHPGFHTTVPALAKYEDGQTKSIEANSIFPTPTQPNAALRRYNVDPKSRLSMADLAHPRPHPLQGAADEFARSK